MLSRLQNPVSLIMVLVAMLGMAIGRGGAVLCQEADGRVQIELKHVQGSCTDGPPIVNADLHGPRAIELTGCSDTDVVIALAGSQVRITQISLDLWLQPVTFHDTAIQLMASVKAVPDFIAARGSPPPLPAVSFIVFLM